MKHSDSTTWEIVMRKMVVMACLFSMPHTVANAQIADNCSLFRSPTGETKTMREMNDLEADLLRKARRGQVVDLSYGGTAKEIAEREANQKKAELAAAEKQAKVRQELASYQCIRDIYGNIPERG